MSVTIRYGSGNELRKEYPEGTTLGQIINDPNVRAVLGYGQNVTAHVGGLPQIDTVRAAQGMTISVQDKACTKAIAA